MKTAIRKGRLSAKAYGLKAVAGEPGVFEAIVSVFGNVDYQGDRIVAGAFAGSLERWKSSGDPIPVIFSHQWDNLPSHIGKVLEAKELLPGDRALPPELAENGGLWTKFALDVDDSATFAPTVDRLLSERRLKEFSFAYDVLDEQRGTDGANELLELEVLEVGPTLKGANPATRLLSDSLETGGGSKLLEILAAGAKLVAHAFGPSDEDATRCVLCGLTRNTAAHNATSSDPGGEKARVPVTFEGAIEAELEAIYAAGVTWARGLDVGNGGFYFLHAEATYPAELRAIVLVEGWDDPIGEGIFYELTFERDDDGELAVKEAAELEIAVEVARKGRSWKHRGRSPLAVKDRATVSDEPDTGKAKSKVEDPVEGKAEDSETRTGSGEADGRDPAVVLLELAELELS